jgi:hypothetical protein
VYKHNYATSKKKAHVLPEYCYVYKATTPRSLECLSELSWELRFFHPSRTMRRNSLLNPTCGCSLPKKYLINLWSLFTKETIRVVSYLQFLYVQIERPDTGPTSRSSWVEEQLKPQFILEFIQVHTWHEVAEVI